MRGTKNKECRSLQNLTLAVIMVVLRWFNVLKLSLGEIKQEICTGFCSVFSQQATAVKQHYNCTICTLPVLVLNRVRTSSDAMFKFLICV